MTEESSQARLQTICLAVIATAVGTYMIYWLRPVLVPFVVSLFVVSGITPILKALESRLGVNRMVAAVLTFVLGIIALGVLGVSLWLSVQQMAEQGKEYRGRVVDLTVRLQTQFEGFSSKLQNLLSLDGGDKLESDHLAADAEPESSNATISGLAASEPVAANISDDPQNSDLGSATDLVANPQDLPLATTALTDAGPQLPSSTRPGLSNLERPETNAKKDFKDALDAFIRDGLASISAELFSIASTSVVVLIYVFFLLLGSVGATEAAPSLQAVDLQVREYLFLKTVISIFTGAVFGFALWMFGVPMSLTFGVLAFLLNYIPNVGPIVASLLPIPFILFNPDGSLLWMVSAIGVTMSVQVISGNVIEPKLMGDSSDLHPVVILLALMFWGMMWGITGMFLATPVTAAIKIVLDGNPATKPIANVMAGRWSNLPILGSRA